MSTQHLVDDSSSDETSIECPKCHAAMRRLRVGEIDIDRCQSCEGVWLDALEKEKLLRRPKDARAADAGAGVPRHAPTPVVMLCPRDKSRLIGMADVNQPHVKYESCTVCGGVFLDAGELKDLSEVTLGEWVRRVVRV
jgi:Zn-finger nucleic acid-binding protein